MYNTNKIIFLNLQIYHDKALYNKGNTIIRRWRQFTDRTM